MGTDEGTYRELFRRSPIARFLIDVEKSGECRFADVNDVAAGYFNMQREDLIGHTPSEVFEHATAEHLEQAFLTCVRTQRPVTINALPTLPGTVSVQAFILNPLEGASGAIERIDITARPDSSDTNHLQRERDDAIMLLTSLFDASGMGIIVTDHSGRMVRVNDSFLEEYGWSREDLLGQDFTLVIPPEAHQDSKKLHDAFIDRGRQGSREVAILRKDGSQAEIIITTALLELSQRRRYMVTTIRDITERKHMIEHLQEAKDAADSANKAKSAFLANMSHELRTPLNAIIGFSELMKNETFGPIQNEKYEGYLTDIHFSARHLLDIINDVLDMSKIEAGKIELVESEVRLYELFETVRKIMGERAFDANVKLAFEIEDDFPNLKGDQRLLRQVLINIVSNAVKFSNPESAVKVRGYRHSGGVRLCVEDSGCGIPEDRIATVLEPFGQVYDANHYQSSGQGTGLGLPIAKAMTKMHDGELTIESREGVGTRVYIDLPPDRILATPQDKAAR